MEELRRMQDEHYEILIELHRRQNPTNLDYLQLVEDCIEILKELNQILIDCRMEGIGVCMEDLKSIYRDSLDFKEFLKEYLMTN